MATIREMYERVNTMHTRLPDQFDKILTELSDDILKLNTEYQMYKGVDNEGNVVGTYARDYKGNGKGYPKEKGKPYNLFVSGDLFKSVDAIFSNYEAKFFSDKPNHPFLKYNQEISKNLFGLIEEHQHKLNYEMIKPLLIKWIKQSIYR